MKKLKIESIKMAFVGACLVWIVPAIILFFCLPTAIAPYIKEPVPMDEVDFSDDVNNLYVSGTIYGIYDYYYEVESKGAVTARKYLINADDTHIMGLRIDEAELLEKANHLMEVSWEYLDGKDDGTLLANAQFEVTGIIRKMPKKDEYFEYLRWSAMPEDMQEQYLTFYLDVNGSEDDMRSILWGVVPGVLIGVFIIIRAVIRAYRGTSAKAIEKYIRNSANPDYTRNRIEYFLQNAPEIKDLYYNHEFICNYDGTFFAETKNIVWVYHTVTSTSINFIPTGKTVKLYLVFADGTSKTKTVSSEEVAKKHEAQLKQLYPHIDIGADREVQKIFEGKSKAR